MSEQVLDVSNKITIDGKEYKFIYVNKAVKYLQKKYGSFTKATESIRNEHGEIDIETIADLVYAGLFVNKVYPEFSEVAEWLDDQTLSVAVKIAQFDIPRAINGTFPEAEENL